VTADALDRLLLPSLEREIRRELTGHAEDHAVKVFARNLRSLLLGPAAQPPRAGHRPRLPHRLQARRPRRVRQPARGRRRLPAPAAEQEDDARRKLEELVRKHQLSVIAIGNGTACRETEEVVST